MHSKARPVFALIFAVAFLVVRPVSAHAQDDLKRVLDRLDASAANFHSTSAEVEYDTIDTEPIEETDVQKGIVYYERKNNSVRMGVHFDSHNGKPSGKAYTYVDGVFRLFEPSINQVTVHSGAAKFESYVNLGFGASGKDLQDKWDITDLGSEEVSDGKGMVKTAKLELIAKDLSVRKTVQKVIIWVDPARAVSLKQIFTLSATSTWVCTYKNFKLNQAVPSEAFTFKTNNKTVIQNQ
jgi:outer membrane lipoprotein-sorting protein